MTIVGVDRDSEAEPTYALNTIVTWNYCGGIEDREIWMAHQ
jgi:hypothetical protein